MTEAPTRPPRRRWRTLLAVTFGVLAVFGALASVVAVWAHEVLFDPTSVSSAVDQALLEPEVTDALADHLTAQVFRAVPVQDLVEERLPNSLSSTAPLLTAGIRVAVHDGLSRALTHDATRQTIVAAAEQSHRRLLRVLEGGRLVDGVIVGDQNVSLNLLPLVGRGLDQLQSTGLLTSVDVPTLSASGDPQEQIRELEAALGRDLPPGFGQLVVYRSERLAHASVAVERAQQAVVLFRKSVVGIVVITVLCLAASVVFAKRRRRALLFLALGLVGAMGLGRALVRSAIDAVPTLAIDPGARTAIRTMVTSLASGLLTAVSLAVLVGLVLSVLAYLTGPDGPGRAVRDRAGPSGAWLRTWLRQHRQLVAVGAFAAVVAVLYVSAFSPGPLVLVALLSGAAVVVAWLPGPAEAIAPAGGRPGTAPPDAAT